MYKDEWLLKCGPIGTKCSRHVTNTVQVMRKLSLMFWWCKNICDNPGFFFPSDSKVHELPLSISSPSHKLHWSIPYYNDTEVSRWFGCDWWAHGRWLSIWKSRQTDNPSGLALFKNINPLLIPAGPLTAQNPIREISTSIVWPGRGDWVAFSFLEVGRLKKESQHYHHPSSHSRGNYWTNNSLLIWDKRKGSLLCAVLWTK